jgi:hypothetical protein
MKSLWKTTAFTLALLMLFSCAACGSGAKKAEEEDYEPVEDEYVDEDEYVEEEYQEPVEAEPAPEEKPGGTTVIDNRQPSEAGAPAVQTPVSDKPLSDDDFAVKEYSYESKYGDTTWILAVTNYSDKTVSISANGTALDAGGNAIGSANMSIDVLAPNETSVGTYYFNGVTGVENVVSQFSYSTSSWYSPILSSLSMQQTLNDKNITVKVTNNSTTCASYTKVYGLFLDANDKLISYDYSYLTDNDGEIKPGATFYAQINCNEPYDHTAVYLVSSSNGKTYSDANAIDMSLFEVREYSYDNSGRYYSVIAVKNNSDKTVEVGGNAGVYDANGNLIGASNLDDISVLAPGEESVGYFYYSNVSGVARQDYSLSVSEETYYRPVIGNLSGNVTLNSKNAVVQVTNNGPYPAKFVEVFIVFLDSNGNTVDVRSGYLTDNDNEIKPNATLSKQLKTDKNFDYIMVYYTGRADPEK